jgi:hypothetical protein
MVTILKIGEKKNIIYLSSVAAPFVTEGAHKTNKAIPLKSYCHLPDAMRAILKIREKKALYK